ncbi:AAA family ATPase [Actinomadura rudentiformis]|uniref:AAA family ATPase n=2 Tax=Actinomadura rudentiformis TaxID=359158 RepID=A0A6H9YFD9_9ACTN|nr:AAA family ATPase [Actinomadura rudentiformis]
MVLITGGLASGKTELLGAVAEFANESGALLLTAAGARDEQRLQMGVMWQLLHSASLPPEVVDRATSLIRVEALDDDADDKAVRPTDTGQLHGLSALVLELARTRPVVISVDDVQFADHASLQVLLYLRRRMRSARIFMALTEWARPSLLRSVFHAEVVRRPHRRIMLGRVSRDGVAELVEHRLGATSRVELAPRCYQITGGNPLLVQALIEDHRAGAGAGETFRQALLDCLHRWDPDLIRVAIGLAVLNEHATPELVGGLLGMKPTTVTQMLAVLDGAGLLRSGRFRHPEIRTTVLYSLTTELATQLHARAAELLYEQGAEPIEVARHLVGADAVPGDWALRVLRQAAEQPLGSGDVELAGRSLELAIRECGDESERRCLRIALVRWAWRFNPAAAARHLPSLHDALRAGVLARHEAMPIIRHLLWNGDLQAATESLEALAVTAGRADARAVTELTFSYGWIYGSPLRLLAGKEAARPPAVRRGAIEDGLSGAEHVLQGSFLGDTIPEAGAIALLLLEYAGERRKALFWHETLLGEAERRGSTTWQAMLQAVRAAIALRQGKLLEADDQAKEALNALHPQSWGVLVGLPLCTRVLANTALHRHGKATELLDQLVPDAMFDTVFGLHYLHASGHHHLAAGRPLAALDDFERCGALMKEWDLDIPAAVPWRTDMAQAHLRLGSTGKARVLLTEQLGRLGPGPSDVRLRGITLRVKAAAGPVPERVLLLQEAVQLLERCDDHRELAYALADLSQAYREQGELSQARLTARRAEQEGKVCGATSLAALLSPGKPNSKPARPEHANGALILSDAERRVASLAASGHTNREIGRKLYVTVSTVEQHLTSAYRKLAITRRADLPMALAGEAETTAAEALAPA